MSSSSTSRVFEAVRLVRDRLVDGPLPADPVTGVPVRVGLVDVDPDGSYDYVQVVADVNDDGITWARMPGGRDEEFDVVIQVRTLAATEDAVLDRLEVLADNVQDAFLDSDTGLLIPLDIAQMVKLEGVGSVGFFVVPFEDGRYRGGSTIRYRLRFRI